MRLKTTDMGEKTLAQKIQTTYAAKIDKNAVNMVMDMLSKLYNNPMCAAIREYVSNAYDADVQVFMKFVDSIKTKDKLINYTDIHKQFGLDENYYEKVPKALRVNTIINVPYYQSKETMNEYVNNMSDNAKLLVMIANNNDFQFETKHVQALIDKVKPEFHPIAEKINNPYKDWL